MSTIVYHQETHSSYESIVLKLNPSKSTIIPHEAKQFSQLTNNSLQNLDAKSNPASHSGWSSIESLSSSYEESKNGTMYIHPLVRRSTCMLSEKSLEMCTESLGNETGVCFTDCSDFEPRAIEARKPLQKLEKKKIYQTTFPPPLTTISGSSAVHFESSRDNGRLVIKAVPTPPMHSYMQAERSEGRLRLSLVRHEHFHADEEECSSNDDQVEREVLRDPTVFGSTILQPQCLLVKQLTDLADSNTRNNSKRCESYVVNKGDEKRDFVQDIEKERSERKEKDVIFGTEISGLTFDSKVKRDMGEFQWPRRCKEGGRGIKRLINLETFWVAT